jgi:PhzF family phenazine biosynthesis protein
MARTLSYNTSDVFTHTPFTGNQLAILHVPHDFTLTQEEKQKIAIEFNYSESVFLHHPSPHAAPATYVVEIFTPESEIPFAGHPTIGTASYIFENLETQRDEISIVLKAGNVKATFHRKTARAAAEIPHDFRQHKARLPWHRVLASQPKLASDAFTNVAIPVVSVVKGVSFGLIDLSQQPALLDNVVVTNNDIPHKEDLDDGWDHGLIADLFYIKKPDSGDGVIRVQQRMIGIGLEDAATGAASAALSAYLALLDGGSGQTYVFELEQGVQMGRRSIIGCEVMLNLDGKSIKSIILSGQAKAVMKGELTI